MLAVGWPETLRSVANHARNDLQKELKLKLLTSTFNNKLGHEWFVVQSGASGLERGAGSGLRGLLVSMIDVGKLAFRVWVLGFKLPSTPFD